MNRDVEGGQQLGTGSLFGINATHARAVNDCWACKISGAAATRPIRWRARPARFRTAPARSIPTT